MPRKPDPSLKTKSGTYYSTIEQYKKYNEKIEKILVRVPEGSRDAITKYVEEKAEDEPTNLKYNSFNGKAYRPSVNAFICYLIEQEMGVRLDDLKTLE